MPLVFFISPADERLLNTIKTILKPPEKGGLTSNNLVFRCTIPRLQLTPDNHLLAEDGVGGREGSFSMCTFWLVEALTRAGNYDKSLIGQAVLMFEDMITYSNHLGLYSEEITRSGEVYPPPRVHVTSSPWATFRRRLPIWRVSVRLSILIVFFRSAVGYKKVCYV
jgi:GH15 family glucan-1,4-alpha-glucosidase